MASILRGLGAGRPCAAGNARTSRPGGDFALDDDVARRIGQELAKRVKHSVGVTIEVEVVAPGSIERSQGQAKRIDDRR
jgi:phenylacetate-CoA ligase